MSSLTQRFGPVFGGLSLTISGLIDQPARTEPLRSGSDANHLRAEDPAGIVACSVIGHTAPSGVSGTIGSVATEDGGIQLTLNGWPLYRYAGDARPGEANGEGSGNKCIVATSAIPGTA